MTCNFHLFLKESFTRKKWRKLLKMMLHSVDSALSMLKGDRGTYVHMTI